MAGSSQSMTPPAADPELQVLYERLARLAGPAPRVCGDFVRRVGNQPHASTTELQRALDCGRAAVAETAGFWMAHGGFAVEGWQVEGLVAGPRGITQHFSYDSYASTFVVAECRVPRLELLLAGLGIHIVCAAEP